MYGKSFVMATTLSEATIWLFVQLGKQEARPTMFEPKLAVWIPIDWDYTFLNYFKGDFSTG